MKSPFPGMDPFIESTGLWEDFHNNLIIDIQRALARIAPPRYIVRTAERSYLVLVEDEGKEHYPFQPDVSISTSRTRKKGPKKPGHVALAESSEVSESLVMRAFFSKEHRETFVEIYEAVPQQRLVTSIEVLSPSNKAARSPGRELYLRKRESHLLGEANLVEIDFLRGGTRMPMVDSWPDSPYVVMVARAGQPQKCRVWPAYFDRPISTITVPLLKPDPDLTLHLQPLIDGIYSTSRYAQSINYRSKISPPLSDQQQTWLTERLRTHSP